MENPIFMVWVAGKGAPKRVYDSLEGAEAAVERIRAGDKEFDPEYRHREAFILEAIRHFPGRKILTLRNGAGVNRIKVEA